jgi:hypothetical protein
MEMETDLADDATIFQAMTQDVMERIAKSRQPKDNERSMCEPWGGLFSKDRNLAKPPIFLVPTSGEA